MTSISYQPLTGCRVPAIAGPRMKDGHEDVALSPWQHGAHIDSLPREAEIEPIEGPANVLAFKR